MLVYSIGNQGTIYHWVRDHRVHHKFSETDADPHNVRNKYNQSRGVNLGGIEIQI